MRGAFCDFYLKMAAVVMVLMFPVLCSAQGQHQLKSKQDDSLKMFLRDYLAGSRSDDREPTRYVPAFVDLKDDGIQEVIVYLAGDRWCGSGGCTALILIPKGSSYRVVAKIATMRLPIRVLRTKLNGWHDIGIMVRVWYGEGNVYAREEKLSFNGRSYRTSARRSVEKIPGEVVISETNKGIPLF